MSFRIYTINMLLVSTFLILVIIEVESNQFKCPEKFGHYPDPGDCSRYYVCDHGRTLDRKCDEGLLYNTYLKTCDWPRNVQCDKGGRRVNTRRNPDLMKTSRRHQKANYEENNQLSPNSDSYEDWSPENDRSDPKPNPPNNENTYPSDEPEYPQNAPDYRQPPPQRQPIQNRPLEDPLLAVKPDFPKWHQDFTPPNFAPRAQVRAPEPTPQPVAAPKYNAVRRTPAPQPPQPRPKPKPKPLPQARPLPAPPTVRPTKYEEEDEAPKEDYEYEAPEDYYDYEEEAPIRNVRKPVKEEEEVSQPNDVDPNEKAKAPSVKRMGWLPGDPDPRHDLDQYHWSMNDAVSYSKDKPRLPEEAFIRMKDFHNVEKNLEEEDANDGDPPPEEYEDYYDDEEPVEEDEDVPDPSPPQANNSPTRSAVNAVQYDDEEEVRSQPRVQPPEANRPQPRVSAPKSAPKNFVNTWKPMNSPAAQPPQAPAPFNKYNTREQITRNTPQSIRVKTTDPSQTSNPSSGSGPVNAYESNSAGSVPKSNGALTTDNIPKLKLKPKLIKTNIHYKNNNSPYLRPVLENSYANSNDSIKDNSKGFLIKSMPRNAKKVIIKKFIKHKNKPREQVVDSSESVTPSVYQLLSDYRKELPDAILVQKNSAQKFRDSIIDNYMNINKPDYILNDKDFDEKDKEYSVPTVSGEGNSDSDNVRDFDKDFPLLNSSNSNIHKNSIHVSNNTSERPEKTVIHILNTDAIVKQQRAQDSISSLTTVLPPVENKKSNKKSTNPYSKPLNEYKPPPKRAPQSSYGFKNTFTESTETTTITPTTVKTTNKPRIRIKTPKSSPKSSPKTILTPKPKSKPKANEWYTNVNYEPKPSNTAISYAKAEKCNSAYCQLPECRCAGPDIPGALHPKQTPQIILLTFDDSVNDLNWHIYDELFNSGRNNPNGCPIQATFYVSHEWTDYGQVQTLYSKGHEMASHSITHSFGEKFSKELWLKEISGQRDLLRLYGGVKPEDVRGMRAPFLQTGGNTMFEMLYEANFTYDSSLPVYDINPPYYPYTLDYAISHECMITPCPSKSFPGFWEVGMVMWEDNRGGRCSMADACFNPKDEQTVYEMVKKNFDRHYSTNRAPFGIYFHARWFLTDHNKKGFIKFMDEINGLNDVYFVTNWQMIQWMRDPQPINNLKHFQPFQCDYSDRPQECDRPNQCKVRFRGKEVRVLKTCQPCPLTYPWRENNGFNNRI